MLELMFPQFNESTTREATYSCCLWLLVIIKKKKQTNKQANKQTRNKTKNQHHANTPSREVHCSLGRLVFVVLIKLESESEWPGM
jgi:hypothetical protein